MGLSRKSRRNIAQFNKIKWSPSRAVYSSKRVPTKLDTYIEAYKEIKADDKTTSKVGEVVGDKIS